MQHTERIFQQYGKPSLIQINEAKDGLKRRKKNEKSGGKFKSITAAISSPCQKQKSAVLCIQLKVILDTSLYDVSF
jgi:hypothetical protein